MYSVEQLQNLMLYFKPQLLALVGALSGMIAKKLIATASDKFLNVLINLMYHIANGHITLNKEKYPKLLKSKRAAYLYKNFNTKKKTRALLNGPRDEKVRILNHFGSVFPILLERLFKSQPSKKTLKKPEQDDAMLEEPVDSSANNN